MNTLEVYNFNKKCRLGVNEDGGYVIGELYGGYDCYISAGVSNEESFSRDFINKYNMNEHNSFAFDGTINSYPYEYTTNISFIKKNINSYNDDRNTDLSFLLSKYNNIFIKMDIEGGEYPWLLSMNETQLSNIKQLVIEFHGIRSNAYETVIHSNKVKCLEKLTKTHYLIHAHGNNYGELIENITDIIELTYINKKYYIPPIKLNIQSLPIINVDFPNNPKKKDIDLNFYPFVNK